MSSEPTLTPMMAQYRRIKGELPKDALLLFRLGDFYEMFFEDAVTGASILGVALTKRGVVPMCGIPYHAATAYIGKMLKAGRKVAICDQVEEARPGQLVKREVTQIVSPGTHFDEKMLNAERSNFIASVYPLHKEFGLSVTDLTTGDFRVTVLPSAESMLTELDRLRPAEIIVPSGAESTTSLIQPQFSCISPYEDWVFAPENAQYTLQEHFKVATLDGFGLRSMPAAVGAAGALLHYLATHLRRDLKHLNRLQCYSSSEFLVLDSISLRNLEILDGFSPGNSKAPSLFAAMNRTMTPMGARKLRDWLLQPLSNLEAIHRRQDAVEIWVHAGRELEGMRQALKEVRDLERTASRLSMGGGNARDLLVLRQALEQTPNLRAALAVAVGSGLAPLKEPELGIQAFNESSVETTATKAPLLETIQRRIHELPELVELLSRAIVEEPPLTIREGGMIRSGYSAELDELRSAGTEGKDWIARLQQQEIESTGIPSLKIRFNSVFGYYIEITKTHLDKVPGHYIRKQTVATGERFITPALKEMEGKILGAEERATKLEYDLFQGVREQVLVSLELIQQTASAIAELDVLCSLAESARLHRYCRPEVSDAGVLRIIEGRHPVLDQSISQERFVPNDTDLDTIEKQIALITGPNMAGKSTYIRQVALLALMAHTGSFIPAQKARVDLVDRIFTRIGANDDLSRGQSTFMVEMSETANILNNATQRSLVVLDEIGRGTSTFDGLSLAWSIVEYLHNQCGAKALFATHYHELTELAAKLKRLRNFNVAVREWNDQIVFLRKIVEGGTDKSYGIHVARLAGVPKVILDRAKEILGNLEESELTPEGSVRQSHRHRAERAKLQKLAPPPQLDLFAD